MLLAIKDKISFETIRPYKGGEGFCPKCGNSVIPKCGSYNIHHWAHERKCDCNHGSDMSEWHAKWQLKFSQIEIEVRVPNHLTGSYNFADVGWVISDTDWRIIEFQHSKIDQEDILEREKLYEKMVWVLDASPGTWLAGSNGLYPSRSHKGEIGKFEEWFKHGVYESQRWEFISHNVNRKLEMFNKPVILDMGNDTYYTRIESAYSYDKNRRHVQRLGIWLKFSCDIETFRFLIEQMTEFKQLTRDVVIDKYLNRLKNWKDKKHLEEKMKRDLTPEDVGGLSWDAQCLAKSLKSFRQSK